MNESYIRVESYVLSVVKRPLCNDSPCHRISTFDLWSYLFKSEKCSQVRKSCDISGVQTTWKNSEKKPSQIKDLWMEKAYLLGT